MKQAAFCALIGLLVPMVLAAQPSDTLFGDQELSLAATLLCSVSKAEAADQEAASSPPASASNKLFNGDFREAGFSLGLGIGSPILGSNVAHDLALAKVHMGWVISHNHGGDKWYGGNLEFVGEFFAGGQYRPEGAYLTGATAILRYNFINGGRIVPFLDFGVGVAATDIGYPDLSTTFQFNSQTGPGFRWFFDSKTALTFQYRFLHISNAGIKHPNYGVNSSLIYAGVTWLY